MTLFRYDQTVRSVSPRNPIRAWKVTNTWGDGLIYSGFAKVTHRRRVRAGATPRRANEHGWYAFETRETAKMWAEAYEGKVCPVEISGSVIHGTTYDGLRGFRAEYIRRVRPRT